MNFWYSNSRSTLATICGRLQNIDKVKFQGTCRICSISQPSLNRAWPSVTPDMVSQRQESKPRRFRRSPFSQKVLMMISSSSLAASVSFVARGQHQRLHPSLRVTGCQTTAPPLRSSYNMGTYPTLKWYT